ncbi:hypothetical protein HYQ46_007272 [Verticillium longisporum]|nr:hypothetical protein HYQ46_007272 [Verticillium longisporum]
MQVAREKQMVAGHNKDEDNGTKIHLLMGRDIVTGVPGRAPPRQGADAWRLLPSSAPAARKQAAWQERPKALDVIPQCRCSPTYQQERK